MKMIRGIKFKVPTDCKKIFDLILNNIDISKYYWTNIERENQVFLLNESNDFLFEKSQYSGIEFEMLIRNNEYYAVFVKLQACKTDACKEIITYSDFLNSDCEMIILITDEIFIDIYVKNSDDLERIKSNAEMNSFLNIQYLTDENDKRDIICAI